MSQKFDFDVDIDMPDRDKLLKIIPHVPASQKKDGQYSRHNTGVYFQNIPFFPLEGYSTLDYKEAAEEGFLKIDFLNNHVYENVRSEEHLDQLINEEPLWELLEHPEIVETLFHLGNYADLVTQYRPRSVEQLAMMLALVRPSKKHLIGKSWEEIEKEIWEVPTDGGYYFKRAHSFAYAMVIVVQLNLMRESTSA